jgi:hypothetical protein
MTTALFAIPFFLILTLSFFLSLRLIIWPSTTRQQFVKRLQDQPPIGDEIARRLASLPLWVVRLWGVFGVVMDVGLLVVTLPIIKSL